MPVLDSVLGSIKGVDRFLEQAASERLDSLTKPRGSLGRLEELASRYVMITGSVRPVITEKVVFTFAGDHGVADEGVSAFPKEVTPQMVYNFLAGGAAINVLARHSGCEVVVVDVGVDHDFEGAPGLVDRKVVRGTRNMRRGPAMTREETTRCIDAGVELACERAAEGVIFGAGDMGIANTTAASAIAALLTGSPVRDVTGHGTGIGDDAHMQKIEVIKDAVRLNSPDPGDPIDVLTKVGGAEIAAITGLVLGAASRSVPVVVDGFISTAGALVAVEMKPEVADYLFASHNSVEKGHRVMLDHMGLNPILDLGLRLGEGTGAALAMSVIEAAVKVYSEMATFGDAGVSEES